jgi:hypothetical protein
MHREPHAKPPRRKEFFIITDAYDKMNEVTLEYNFWLVQAPSLWYETASLGFSTANE